jgi:zinc protease
MSMHSKIRRHSFRWIAACACLLVSFSQAFAQTSSIPESQELLNGLKILFWPKPGSPDVLVKLRIHSGSAFDLAGKAGEMALLGDVMFPDPATVDYFTEQMGGKLNIAVNYDSMTVTMVGKAEQLDNIMEVLRNGILATPLTPEVVNRVRDTRIKLVRDTAVSPSIVADRAIALRLFGDFPYGRPSAGSPEDLARIERGDLMLVRERFLNSNNATLAIVGGFDRTKAMRTLKQLFGPWRKSEQIVPSTFQAAKSPDSRALIVNAPSPTAEIRLAWRGVSRSDPDFYVAQVLARVAQDRWRAASPELASKPVFVKSDSYLLPGIFMMGSAVDQKATADSVITAKKIAESLFNSAVGPAEVLRARQEILSEDSPAIIKAETETDNWLDMDTYRLTSVSDRSASIQAVSPGDVQRVATRLLKDAPVATVVVGDAQQLKPLLQGRVQFEVLGEMPQQIPTTKPPTKPGKVSSPG